MKKIITPREFYAYIFNQIKGDINEIVMRGNKKELEWMKKELLKTMAIIKNEKDAEKATVK